MTPIQWWRINFLFAELLLAMIIAGSVALWGEMLGGSLIIESLLRGNRAELYSALATIFGALLGFAITATSIALGYSTSDRLALVLESVHFPMLWKTFSSANKALAFATIVALAALILDRDQSPTRFLTYLNGFAGTLAMLRVTRCLWVLDNVMSIVTRSPSQRGTGR